MYDARGRIDDEPGVVVGIIQEIKEIPRMPQLPEEIPFVGAAFRAGLVASEQDNDGGGPGWSSCTTPKWTKKR